MNYGEYLKATGGSNILWMKKENQVGVKFPFKSGTGCFTMDFTNSKVPYLVVGDYAGFKDALEITLLRDFHPSLVRITEICSETGFVNQSPLFERTLNMRRYIVPNGCAGQLSAYLVAVTNEVVHLIDTQSTGNDICSILILSNVIRDIILKAENPMDKTVAIEKLNYLRYIAAEKNLTIVFMETVVSDWLRTLNIVEDFIGVCCKCDHTTSGFCFGTDIGSTLKDNFTFYISDKDDLVKVVVPEFEDEEIDNILTKVICSR